MIKIGVIGCGHWGKNLVRNFHEIGTLHAICDTSWKRTELMTKAYPGTHVYGSVESLLNSDVDAVVIATPAGTHFGVAKKSLLAGKDVFVEKPLALSYSEGQELVTLAKERKKILMVGHILEYHSAVEKMKAMIKEGKIGKINYIYSSRLNLGKFRKEENVFWSFAPHDISLILSLLGEMPKRIVIHGGAFLNKETMDVTVMHMEFSDDVKAHIFVSWLHPYKEQRFVVVGSKAMLVFDDLAKDKLTYYPSIKEKTEAVKIKISSTEPLEVECRHFLECIDSRKVPRTNGKQALRVLEILTNSRERRYFRHESSYVDDKAKIGEGTKIWHFCHISKGAKIGKNCTLGQNVFVGQNVRIGDNVKLQNNVSVYEGVTLEDDTFIGPSAVFTNVLNPRSTIPRKNEFKETLVKKGATIGANSTIVCGATIGEHAFIGAGAVVTKDILPYALAYGVPAKFEGMVDVKGEKVG